MRAADEYQPKESHVMDDANDRLFWSVIFALSAIVAYGYHSLMPEFLRLAFRG